MSLLTCADVIESLTGVRPLQATQVITEAVVDVRNVSPGSLFIAMRGQETGQAIAQAFDQGAVLALMQIDPLQETRTFNILHLEAVSSDLTNRDLPLCLRVEDSLEAFHQITTFWRKRLPEVTAIAITGNVGKTTTKDLVTEMLEQRYRTLKNTGNTRSDIDIPLTLFGLTGGHQRVVLEVNIPGKIAFFHDMVAPRIGIVTNVGSTSVDETGSQAELVSQMTELVRNLPPDGFAILNYDDPWVRGMASQTPANVLFYGLSPQADIWADEVEGLGMEGIRFQLHFGSETMYLKVPMLGRHAVHTALRAAAVGIVEGFSYQEIAHGLHFSNTQLRLVAVRSDHGALLLDDTYNASPESTLAALNLLYEMQGRKVAVLGGMPDLGPYHYQGHQLVGMRAAQIVDMLITVGELGREIADAARMAWLPTSVIFELTDTDEAIKYLNIHLTAEDVVLIKGPQSLHMDRITAALEADE
ncbi:MAG TPA: UDP-N-acetylmuramoyl-tripeptide--D-alanyl-D-alanine ligase [Anaerolineales bacterium]|nr:UDP-N-acetylmuramoyl-tripeptide--D-alanyl-D-alanine ligase [Anaerolineales bacterium]